MGFAEALSDDGTLTGRGHPLLRGFVCGCMTAVGGIGHTLPFLTDRFTLGNRYRGSRGRYGARRNHVGASPVHGNSDIIGGNASGFGRSDSLRDGHSDRQLVMPGRDIVALFMNVVPKVCL